MQEEKEKMVWTVKSEIMVLREKMVNCLYIDKGLFWSFKLFFSENLGKKGSSGNRGLVGDKG